MAEKSKDYTVSGLVVEFQLNASLHPLEAILNATYFFIEDYYIFLDRTASAICIRMESKNKTTKAALRATAGEFRNHLVSEMLRLELSKRNRNFRASLLKQAITSAMSPPQFDAQASAPQPGDAMPGDELLELDEELKRIIEKTKDMSYEEDLLGIGIPVTDDDQTPVAVTSSKTTKKTAKKKKKKS